MTNDQDNKATGLKIVIYCVLVITFLIGFVCGCTFKAFTQLSFYGTGGAILYKADNKKQAAFALQYGAGYTAGPVDITVGTTLSPAGKNEALIPAVINAKVGIDVLQLIDKEYTTGIVLIGGGGLVKSKYEEIAPGREHYTPASTKALYGVRVQQMIIEPCNIYLSVEHCNLTSIAAGVTIKII